MFLLEEREVPATYVVAGTTEADLTAAINSALADANTVNTISFQAPTVPAGTVFNLASDPGAGSFYTLNKSFIFDAPAGVTINRHPGDWRFVRENGPQMPVGPNSNRRAPNRVSNPSF